MALTALIWGSAFVAQSVGMDYIGPFTFNSIRSFMGGIVLLPVIFIMKRQRRKNGQGEPSSGDRKTLIIGGICCGIALRQRAPSSRSVLCTPVRERRGLSRHCTS